MSKFDSSGEATLKLTKRLFGSIRGPMVMVALAATNAGCLRSQPVDAEQTQELAEGDGSAGTTQGSLTTGSQQRIRAGERNVISVETLPSARCSLHAAGTADPSQSLMLVTDEEGTASFSVTSPVGEGVTEVLDCENGRGVSGQYSIKLQADPDAPLVDIAKPTGVVRPPLAGDPLAATQEELHAMGYATRPDPVANPDRYALWLKSVSAPSIRVSASGVAMPNIRHTTMSNQTSPDWAGYMAASSGGAEQFTNVTGWWYVPTIANVMAGVANYSSAWIGVGGYSAGPWSSSTAANSGMWQGGIDADAVTQGGTVVETNDSWVEFVNAAGPCCTGLHFPVAKYPVKPADEFVMDLYFGTASGTSGIAANPRNQYLWYFAEDISQGWYIANTDLYDPDGKSQVPVSIAQEAADYTAGHPGSAPITIGINGYTAEWIVETPQISTDPPSNSALANFHSLLMWNAQAWDTSAQNYVNFNALPYVFQLNMTSKADTMATSSIYASGELVVNWEHYR